MHSTAPAGESARVFNECEAMTPSYLLRRRLERATASPEAFFNVRAQFVQRSVIFVCGDSFLVLTFLPAPTNQPLFVVINHFGDSMTAFSIGSYILGIGDRHLDNFLLDQCDGEPRLCLGVRQ